MSGGAPRSRNVPSPLSRTNRTVLAVYAGLTVLLTYPLSLNLGTLARDYGDPLLNSWIMAWELDTLATGNLSGFFDTNVFFPFYNTLAYSEFLIPQAIATAPVYFLTGNPLLAHNVAMLLSFTTTAFCAYLLAKHLTADRFAAFVAGLIFAFNPFMFDHLSHVQVLGAAGLPLSLLWLHRYFETGEFRYIGWFSITYVVQALGNAYYAVYLTYMAAVFILFRAFVDRALWKPRFWAHMSAHAAFSFVILAPFFGRFLALRTSMGFTREMTAVWGLPFLAASAINRLYGPGTTSISSPEAKLFPGLIAAALALVGAAWYLWARSPAPEKSRRAARELTYRGLGWVAFVTVVAIISILTWGGFSGQVFSIPVSSTSLRNPLLIIGACLVGRTVLRSRHEQLRVLTRNAWGNEVFYIGLLVVVAVLSMGGEGPYRLLYDYVPGFSGIRAVPRIHILTMLGLSMLAAFGVMRLRTRFPSLGRVLAMTLVLLICVEYLSVPIPMIVVDDVPAVYAWLAEQPGDFAVMQYPLGFNDDRQVRYSIQYQYNSRLHGKKLVNGYSGFFSPVFAALDDRAEVFPSDRTVTDLEALGVRYVVVDQAYYHHRAIAIRQNLWTLEPRMVRVAELGDYLVYELAAPWQTRDQVYENLAAVEARARPIDRGGWVIRGDGYEDEKLAADGDPETRWKTALQTVGMGFEVDLGRTHEVVGINMGLGRFVRDYPFGFRVEVSRDGDAWQTVAQESEYLLPITEFLRPFDIRVPARFDAVDARFVRVLISEPRPDHVWSITEFDVLTPNR